MILNKAANEEFYSCICFDARLNKSWKENIIKIVSMDVNISEF